MEENITLIPVYSETNATLQSTTNINATIQTLHGVIATIGLVANANVVVCLGRKSGLRRKIMNIWIISQVSPFSYNRVFLKRQNTLRIKYGGSIPTGVRTQAPNCQLLLTGLSEMSFRYYCQLHLPVLLQSNQGIAIHSLCEISCPPRTVY